MALNSSPVLFSDDATASQYNALRLDAIGHVHDGTDTPSIATAVSSATALTVAKAGANYALQVDTATASAVTGLKITSAAAAAGLALAVISSGSNENLTLDAKGSGTITVGGTSTGAITLGRQTTIGAGNLIFGTTGQRIRGDFSNATHANRILFQSSTTDGITGIGVIPNGTSTTGRITLYGATDPDNANILSVSQIAGTSIIASSKIGSPSYGALAFQATGTTLLQIHASAGVSILDATDPGAAKLRIAGATTITTGGLTVTGTLGSTSIDSTGIQLLMNRAANNYVTASDVAGILDLGVTGTTAAIEVAAAGTVTVAKALTVTTGGLRVSAGNIGIGAAADATTALFISGATTSGSSQAGVFSTPTFSSAATAFGYGGYFRVGTAATSFTMAEAIAVAAINPSKGAGSTITNNYGVWVQAQSAGGTNNYGVYINAPSGGSGSNVGLVNVGTTSLGAAVTVTAGDLTLSTGSLNVTLGNITLPGNAQLGFGVGGAGYGLIRAGTGGMFVVNNAGNANNLTITDAGAVTVRAGLTVTTGGLTVTAGTTTLAPGIAWASPTNGTGANYGTFVNTSGTFYLGLDGSTGGSFYGVAYALTIAHTGAYPIVFATSAAIKMQVLGTGLSIGATTAARGTTEPTNAINIFNGTAPAGTLTNGVTLYAAAGELRVMDAGGTSTLLSPHDDDGYWVFDSASSPTGKRLRIDVEKLLRFLNEHHGLDFVHEETV